MPEITAALLGIPHPHALFHLRTLQVSERVDRIAIWDPDQTEIDKLTGDQLKKVAGTFTDLDKLVSEMSPLFAVAVMPNNENAEICSRMFEAGVHVLSEKPIGCTAEEVSHVVDEAARANLELGVFYTSRHVPAMRLAQQLMQEGAIGRLTSVEARMVTSQVRFRDPTLWLFDRKRAGGGILSWLGCHYIDLMRFVSGEEVATVSGFTETLSGEQVDVEDVASVSWRFKSGALGSIQAGYQLALSAGGYREGSYDIYLAFRGTEGSIVWYHDEKPMTLHVESSIDAWKSDPSRKFEFEIPENPAYGGVSGLEFVHDFISAAQGNGEPPAAGEDALAVARIVEAAYESSSTGRHVKL